MVKEMKNKKYIVYLVVGILVLTIGVSYAYFKARMNGGGNGQLKYPIALMTVDEVSFAGDVYQTNLSIPMHGIIQIVQMVL